ncbi:signal recognition particle-docking protein FtsY [secondary endosymbiont of Heteropsylla cubana]|uniref:Signal recognition particle receptor FtsY n=1 Tax=secondary endosymbiont of Heteropsylla cubana TaxID=134287 RepID=J3TG91_9ENTR|nr:signal recognition particle-docking protein FtsY [secondary endosymbiont of Heteropsylla cubana]AFP85387.1 signal recognition particle-docking protein FtsY [secondary endosymbiont of Heteropsylla cubana]
MTRKKNHFLSLLKFKRKTPISEKNIQIKENNDISKNNNNTQKITKKKKLDRNKEVIEINLSESTLGKADIIPKLETIIQSEPFEEQIKLASQIHTTSFSTNNISVDNKNISKNSKSTEFFIQLKRSLLQARENLGFKFNQIFHSKKVDNLLFEQLEERLLLADIGVNTSYNIISSLMEYSNRNHLKDSEELYKQLQLKMTSILISVEKPLKITRKSPFVILVVGVNGVGKTTTIGKLAHIYQSEGKTVMLAAGDTFRAAAVEQLQIWGKRNQVPVVAKKTGGDSASVIFEAIQIAQAQNINVLIADTAGRLQNKKNLMDELKKIVKVIKKLDVEAPHEVMLILDSSTGQNAISQAKLFNSTVTLTGITLTKLDGTAKGGIIFSLADQFKIPIRFIGIGNNLNDLQSFKANDFINALFVQ